MNKDVFECKWKQIRWSNCAGIRAATLDFGILSKVEKKKRK